jgi:hypothetical protein
MSEVAQPEAKEKKPAAKPKAAKKPAVQQDGRVGQKGIPGVGNTRVANKGPAKVQALTNQRSVNPAKAAGAKVPTEKKPRQAKAARPSYSKFEQFAIDGINVNATEASPYVSFAKIKQYAIDYVEKTRLGSIPKLVKRALLGLEVKKILKAKRDSYAFAAAGKGLALRKVPERTKVVREPTKADKPADAEVTIAKPLVTTSGRTSRPVGAT